MKRILNFFANLFKKKEVKDLHDDSEDIITDVISVNNVPIFLLIALSKLLLNNKKYTANITQQKVINNINYTIVLQLFTINVLNSNNSIICIINIQDFGLNLKFQYLKKHSNIAKTEIEIIKKHLYSIGMPKGEKFSFEEQQSFFGKELILDLFDYNPSKKLYINEETEFAVQNFVLNDMIKNKGKQIYLFAGPYGTSKTETALIIADQVTKKLEKNLIYLKDVGNLSSLFEMSENTDFLDNCIILAEDIDQIGDFKTRNADINNFLNIIDGAASKNKNIKIIFTTNHANNLAPVLKRPGRIDTMILFDLPNAACRKNIFTDALKNANSKIVEKASSLTEGLSTAFCFMLADKYNLIEGSTIKDFELIVKSTKFHLDTLNYKEEEPFILTREVVLESIKNLVSKTVDLKNVNEF